MHRPETTPPSLSLRPSPAHHPPARSGSPVPLDPPARAESCVRPAHRSRGCCPPGCATRGGRYGTQRLLFDIARSLRFAPSGGVSVLEVREPSKYTPVEQAVARPALTDRPGIQIGIASRPRTSTAGPPTEPRLSRSGPGARNAKPTVPIFLRGELTAARASELPMAAVYPRRSGRSLTVAVPWEAHFSSQARRGYHHSARGGPLYSSTTTVMSSDWRAPSAKALTAP